jgi:sphingomyelin phosphodiesterase 2
MRVRVATLNAWAMPTPLGQDVAFRMRAIGEKLRDLDVDVMAFQEVWTAAARALLVEGGRRAGFRDSWQPSAWVGDGGLLVLSRLPIQGAFFEPFDLRGHAERWEHGEYWSGKGFAVLRVELAGGRLLLVDTHLHARYNQDAPHRYRPHRVAQLAQLVTALARTPDPAIVVGDLNFEEGDPEYVVLRGLTGMRDVAADLDLREPTVLDTNPYRPDMRLPSRRIDFVFVRGGAARALLPRSVQRVFDDPVEIEGRPRTYSNHAGVVAEIELVAASAPVPAPPDPHAVALALGLLAEGREHARRRARDFWSAACIGAGATALSATGARFASTRRRFVQRALYSVALVGLVPGAAGSILSEHYVPDEIRAFEEAADRVARLGAAEDLPHPPERFPGLRRSPAHSREPGSARRGAPLRNPARSGEAVARGRRRAPRAGRSGRLRPAAAEAGLRIPDSRRRR